MSVSSVINGQIGNSSAWPTVHLARLRIALIMRLLLDLSQRRLFPPAHEAANMPGGLRSTCDLRMVGVANGRFRGSFASLSS